MTTIFYWAFIVYIVSSFIAVVLCMIDDAVNDNNRFEHLGLCFIPIFNTACIFVFPFTFLKWNRIINYIIKTLYTEYSLCINKRDEKFEKKHNITWTKYDN